MNNLTASAAGIAAIIKAKSVATKAWAVDQPGVDLIEGLEGLRLNAYQDSAGVWTIGWGSTHYANGKPVKQGDKLLNKECADDLFKITLKDFEADINRVVKLPLNQNQFDALLSFHYNTGAMTAIICTLRTKLNAGDYAGAAAQFLAWVYITVNGQKKVSDVLMARRMKEQKLFLTPIK